MLLQFVGGTDPQSLLIRLTLCRLLLVSPCAVSYALSLLYRGKGVVFSLLLSYIEGIHVRASTDLGGIF